MDNLSFECSPSVFILALMVCGCNSSKLECVQKATRIFTKPNFEHFQHIHYKTSWPQQTNPTAVNPFDCSLASDQ